MCYWISLLTCFFLIQSIYLINNSKYQTIIANGDIRFPFTQPELMYTFIDC